MIMEVDEGEEEEQEQGYYYKPDLPTQLSTDCVIPSDASERRYVCVCVCVCVSVHVCLCGMHACVCTCIYVCVSSEQT